MEENDIRWLRILVIDDEPFMRQLIIRVLKELEVQSVTEAGDGAEGLARVDDSAHGIDLIICDLEMPNMDGFAFVKNLRAKAPSPDADIPVLIVTGHSEPNSVKSAVEAGINGYLVKPISKQSLQDRIAAAMGAAVIKSDKLK